MYGVYPWFSSCFLDTKSYCINDDCNCVIYLHFPHKGLKITITFWDSTAFWDFLSDVAPSDFLCNVVIWDSSYFPWFSTLIHFITITLAKMTRLELKLFKFIFYLSKQDVKYGSDVMQGCLEALTKCLLGLILYK